jgi:hypothetical protein
MNTPSTNPNYWAEIDFIEDNIKNNKSGVMSKESKSERIQNAIVDLTKPIKKPPMIISGGIDMYGEEIPVMTEGNFSAICGVSKSRKSFFKSAIMATYTGAEFGQFKGHRKIDKYIIDVDTEQSKYHCQRVFKRNEQMAGYYAKYIPVSLREYEPKDRLQILYDIVELYSGNIGLISIDGYADLIEDFNNIDQSNEVINAMMKWTTQEKCHITGIIHLNPGMNNKKPQGHLGSFILRKCESVIYVEKDETNLNNSIVNCTYSRNIPFSDFSFEINNGLPELI